MSETSRFSRAASVAAATALAYAITLLAVANPHTLAFAAIAQLVFVLPGVFILRAVAGAGGGWLIPLSFGPLLGQALGSLALTGLWAAGGRGVWLLIAAPLLVAILIKPAARLRGRWRLPVTAPGDLMALAALLLIVPIVAGLPFAHVGEITGEGQFYRAYFTADYVWRRAVVAELAKGAFLPINPYFQGDALHYYWMPHLLTAVQYRFAEGWAALDELLLVRSVFIDALFVAFLYGTARLFGVRPWASAAGVALVIASSSFEGLYALYDFGSNGVSLREVRNLNIDAITRWYMHGIPIDGLQRLLFYQPHHAVGYAMGLLGLYSVSHRARPRDAAAMFVSGVLLALSILISSFAGLMFTAAAALFEGVAVVRRLDFRRAIAHAIAAGIPLAIATALVFALRYVDTGGSVVAFGVNRVATHSFWLVTLLSFGPVLIISAAAIALALSARRRGLAPPKLEGSFHWSGGGLGVFGALAGACVIFYFFINVRDHQDVYVGWRVGHLLFMAATVLAGIVFEQMEGAPTPGRIAAWVAVAIVTLTGLPTTVIDVYNTQDLSNRNEAPGFRWTLVLTPDDRQVFDWIRHNTKPDAIFQVDPLVRDSETWAYLPAFAERRMAVGLPISMVPLQKYQQGSEQVRTIFEDAPLSAYERAVKSGINYIIVGPPERTAHPDVEQRFDSLGALMPVAFRNGTISIYEVARP
ncbi:MAG: hypothetical protein Q7R30_02785 [Acidobacteriota bacterium]|nr:hypothetical protein [Acidobacteriota bacterium]